jgi:hypothetical protein
LEEGPGEGGKAITWGRGKGGGESRSITGEGYWDWEVPRGRPRKKEVRIFCLDGGESELTAWGKTPSMRQGSLVEMVVEGGEEIIKERRIKVQKVSARPLTVAGPTTSPRMAQKAGKVCKARLIIPFTPQFSLSLLLYTQKKKIKT